MNQTGGSVVGCDIELKNGDSCGVQAIGRCSICERAFCLTHQAHGPYRIYQCTPCVAKTMAEAGAPRKYFEKGEARTTLLASGVPPVDMYWFWTRWEQKKGLFGQRDHFVEGVTPLGRGWLLGEFRWKYTVFEPRFSKSFEENLLTALLVLDEPCDALVAESLCGQYGLYPVKPCSGGYTPIKHDSLFLADFGNGEITIAIMQTIKRLTGASS